MDEGIITSVRCARRVADALSPARFLKYLRAKDRCPMYLLDRGPQEWTRYTGPFPPTPRDDKAIEKIRDCWGTFIWELPRTFLDDVQAIQRSLASLPEGQPRTAMAGMVSALTALVGDEFLEMVHREWPVRGDRAHGHLTTWIRDWEPDFEERHKQLLHATEALEPLHASEAKQQNGSSAGASSQAGDPKQRRNRPTHKDWHYIVDMIDRDLHDDLALTQTKLARKYGLDRGSFRNRWLKPVWAAHQKRLQERREAGQEFYRTLSRKRPFRPN